MLNFGYFIFTAKALSRSELSSGYYPQYDVPTFVGLPSNNDLFNLSGKTNVDLTLSSWISSEQRQSEYYLSSINLNSAKFYNCFAFGAGLSAANGGAIFVHWGSIYSKNSRSLFESNKASIGGAICSISSAVYFSKDCPEFKGNEAYKYGGAMYFQGAYAIDNGKLVFSRKTTMFIEGNGKTNSIFTNNVAGELGGAISLSSSVSCGIESMMFRNNSAGLSGGALCSSNVQLSIFECTFYLNAAGSFPARGVSSASRKPLLVKTPVFIPRGGGAIFYIADEYQAGYKNNAIAYPMRTLYTDSCCFAGDRASNATSFGNGLGHEIMLSGYVSWISYSDFMHPRGSDHDDIDKNLVSFYSGNRSNVGMPLICRYNLSKYICVGSFSYSDYYDNEVFSFATTSRRDKYSGTDYVASPTKYTYRATPITALVYSTKGSFITSWKTMSIITAPTGRTIKSTLVNTPYKTLLKTLMKTLVKTQYNTLLETLVNTPNNTLAQTNDEAKVKTPYNTLLQTNYATLFNTPYNTLLKTIDATGITPYNTLSQTNDDEKVNTPYNTLLQTFHPTEFQTLDITVHPSTPCPSPTTDLIIKYSHDPKKPAKMTLTEQYTITLTHTDVNISIPNGTSYVEKKYSSFYETYTKISTMIIVNDDDAGSSKLTYTESLIMTSVQVQIIINESYVTSSYVESSHENTNTSVLSRVIMYYTYMSYSFTESYSSIIIIAEIDESDESNESHLSNTEVISIALSSAAGFFIIVGIVVFLYRNNKTLVDDDLLSDQASDQYMQKSVLDQDDSETQEQNNGRQDIEKFTIIINCDSDLEPLESDDDFKGIEY